MLWGDQLCRHSRNEGTQTCLPAAQGWPTSSTKTNGVDTTRGKALARGQALGGGAVSRPARGLLRTLSKRRRFLGKTQPHESRTTRERTGEQRKAGRSSFPFSANGARTYGVPKASPKGFHSGATRPSPSAGRTVFTPGPVLAGLTATFAGEDHLWGSRACSSVPL